MEDLGQVCSICLIPIESETDNKVQKLICKHIFHFDCIRKWYQKSIDCPMCRNSILLVSVDCTDSSKQCIATVMCGARRGQRCKNKCTQNRELCSQHYQCLISNKPKRLPELLQSGPLSVPTTPVPVAARQNWSCIIS